MQTGYVTVKELKKTFVNAKAGETSFLAKKIFRPASFYMTYIFIKCGIKTPNAASYVGMIIGLLGAFLLAFYPEDFSLIAAICYFFFYISDYCDGNLARYYNKATYFGKLLDGFIDTIVGAAYIIAVHIAMFTLSADAIFLKIGLLVCSLYYLGCVYVSRYSFVARWIQTDHPELKVSHNPFSGSEIIFRKIMNYCTDLNSLLMVGLLVIKFNLAWFALYAGNALIISLTLIIYTHYQAEKNLHVSRKSKWQN